ncbi:MAG: RidA family protein [Bryobacteraceae bacterium]|nr:RidA family protein [Bryobacteraceae bacterium]
MKHKVATQHAPAAIGPYSQAIVHKGIAYLSGQIPLDPATGTIVEGDIVVQTERVLQNLQAVLVACGSSMERVLKTTVFLKDMADFPKMNEVYAKYLGDSLPARSTVQAAALPRNVMVEIDCIAIAPELSAD